MLDEAVHLCQPNAAWAQLAFAEIERLSSWLSLPPRQIEHVGSTAVPSLLAKPIIDLQAGVFPFPPSAQFCAALQASGYTNHGEAGVPGRLYFSARGPVAFNVHVVALAGELWVTNLLLRSYLRQSSSARERYARAKEQAISSGATTLLAYSQAKAGAITQLVSEARAWQSAG